VNLQEEMARRIRDMEERITTLEAHERLLIWLLATEDVELIDAGSAGASNQDWVEIEVGGNTGYIRIFSSKSIPNTVCIINYFSFHFYHRASSG